MYTIFYHIAIIIIIIHGGTDEAQESMLNKWEFTEFMLACMLTTHRIHAHQAS
jgi:hypothetical protein